MSLKDKKINIVAVCGSARPNSMTGKVLAIVLDEIGQNKELALQVIDPTLFDLNVRDDDNSPTVQWLKESITQATGVILATPEYHGSYSSVMKLIIDHLGFPSVLSGKPVVLMGVASGQIGAIKALEHLRSVCSHVGAIVLPSVVSVARVNDLFDENGRCKDPKMEKRIRSVATTLIEYINQNVCPRLILEEMVREK